MKHEHFKVFGVLGVTNPTSAPLDEFLTSGHISPKSISLVTSRGDKGGTSVIIGYVPSRSNHNYSVVSQNIGNPADLGSAIESAANTHEGVVCQHVEIEADGTYVIVFLVATPQTIG